jgi:hypothetical protein
MRGYHGILGVMSFSPRDGTVDRKDNVFGFWRPHGLDGEDEEVFVSRLLQCKE